MRTKPNIAKTGNSAGAVPPNNQPSAPGADFDAQMSVAEGIMRDDREVLRALAGKQLATAREVMSRRRRALRELAK